MEYAIHLIDNPCGSVAGHYKVNEKVWPIKKAAYTTDINEAHKSIEQELDAHIHKVCKCVLIVEEC